MLFISCHYDVNTCHSPILTDITSFDHYNNLLLIIFAADITVVSEMGFMVQGFIQASKRPPERFRDGGDFCLWLKRFEKYVEQIQLPK